MSTVTLPLSLLETRSANSYKAHKQHQAKRQQAEPQLSRAVEMRDCIDGWCQLAAKYDNEFEDFAAHKKGLVVLDQLPAQAVSDSSNQLSGELSIDQASGQKSRARFTLKSQGSELDDVTLTYSKRAKKETYTESYGGHATRLIIDHDKGTLTLIEPAL